MKIRQVIYGSSLCIFIVGCDKPYITTGNLNKMPTEVRLNDPSEENKEKKEHKNRETEVSENTNMNDHINREVEIARLHLDCPAIRLSNPNAILPKGESLWNP